MNNSVIGQLKQGQWTRKNDDVCYWYECSECNGGTPRNKWGHEWFSLYCPSCGSEMEMPQYCEDDI